MARSVHHSRAEREAGAVDDLCGVDIEAQRDKLTEGLEAMEGAVNSVRNDRDGGCLECVCVCVCERERERERAG